MGAVNAAIIVGSKSDHPEKSLEEFWLEIAESNHMIIPDTYLSLIMIVSGVGIPKAKYLLLQPMLQYLEFQKCLFQDGGVLIIPTTDQGILSCGEKALTRNHSILLIQEAGLMYMIILLLQRLLTNTLIIKRLTWLQLKEELPQIRFDL